MAAVGSPAPAESDPPGDIPDTVAYVRFTLPGRSVTFTHPEGWAQSQAPGGVRFTDKLNSVTVRIVDGPAPTVNQVRRDVVPTLAAPSLAPTVDKVEAISLPAGPAVRVTWRVNSDPDAVTGRVYRDEVVTLLTAYTGMDGPLQDHERQPEGVMIDVVEATDLFRFFHAGEEEILALRGVSVSLGAGEATGIAMGPVDTL